MKVFRCHVPPEAWSTDLVTLDPEEMHHLVHVLRAEVGQEVTAFDGAGREATMAVHRIGRDEAVLRMLQQRTVRRPPVALTLVQAVPREQKMDVILQKATELGAARIAPVITDHGVVRLRGDDDDGKRGRWDKIVLNAAKQCGSAWLPELRPVQPLLEALPSMPPHDVLLVGSLEPDARPFREVLAEVRARAPAAVAFFVGPEGDFSGREYAAIRQAGARPVSFGSSVFRVETAAIYALSVLRYELGAG